MKERAFFHSHSSGNLRQTLSMNGKPLLVSGMEGRQEISNPASRRQYISNAAEHALFGEACEVAEQRILFMQYTAQLEEFKKEISESLRYAQNLQNALLQEKEELQELFPQSFILSRPKHVVSGDFYWFKDTEDRVLVSVGDCTGHGIPGALIAMLGLNTLHSAFNFHKLISPSLLLNFLDVDFNRKLSHKSKGKVMNDSMDIAICEIDKKEMTLTISGASSKVYLVRDGKAEQFRTEKYSIGNAEPEKSFEFQQVPLQKGDAIYLSSDGFADQFGGEKGKKLGSKAFGRLLASLSNEAPEHREKILGDALTDWQGTQEQTDDILVMGLSV